MIEIISLLKVILWIILGICALPFVFYLCVIIFGLVAAVILGIVAIIKG